MLFLEKPTHRDFIVLNLSDPQLSNGEWQDARISNILTQTVKTLVDRLCPDLITISGDLSWAGQDQAYDNLANFLDSLGIPWAPVWGNHDNQGGASYIDRLADRYLAHPYCLYKKGDPALGNGNYVIAIREGDKIVSALLMMDSHDRLPAEEGGELCYWAKFSPAQITWYREEIAKLDAMGCHNTAIITHIPIYAYREASKAAYKADIDLKSVTPALSEGSDIWNEGYQSSVGVQYEEICSYPFDDHVFPVLRDLGSTKYVVAGHDHVNNWMIDYQGIKLCYSLKCGNGCYWNPILNGGTALIIGSDGIKEAKHEYVDASDF